MMRSRDAILQELAREAARLAELERAREGTRERIESLRSDLTATSTRMQPPLSLPPPLDRKAPRSAAEKVGLFRSLFRREGAATADQLASIPDTAERLVVATGRYIGEGFDDPRLDTLFLAMRVSWKGALIQYSGRLHRHHPSKTEVRIYDYVDREVPMLLRMFEKRVTAYRAIGYARGEAPLGFAEPPNEHTVEYDEEALRHFREDE